MPTRGKFIALEGIDGSGKRTQLDFLAAAFAKRAIPHVSVSFPRYEGFFGRMVAQFLNGEFGPLDAVDPHFSALLFAGDRLEAKETLDAELAQGKAVLADRYIGSNLAHQGARVPADRREEFLAWLRKLEYQVYGLPAEDLIIYLRLPAAEAQRLVGRKAAREYTHRSHDLQESNLAHLDATAAVYDRLSKDPAWVTINCLDSAAAAPLPPAAIHRAVLAALDTRLLSVSAAL